MLTFGPTSGMTLKSFESGRQQAQAVLRSLTGLCSERQANQEIGDDSLKRDEQEGIETKRNLHPIPTLFGRLCVFFSFQGTLFVQRFELFFGHPLFSAR